MFKERIRNVTFMCTKHSSEIILKQIFPAIVMREERTLKIYTQSNVSNVLT